MNKFNLNGKLALVTGALGLLGKEHCKALIDAGATVLVADLSNEHCNEFCNQLGEKAIPIVLDITSQKNVIEVKDYIAKHFGVLDILVNNAAINDHFGTDASILEQSSFENYPIHLLQKSWEVNVQGMVFLTQTLADLLKKSNAASVINIASTYGLVGPDQRIYTDAQGNQLFYKTPAYPITKGAVINFTRYLAAYWGEAGIRVNSLSPGGVENGQDIVFLQKYQQKTPLNRMAKKDDYAGALVFLASEASSYMTGANLVVDGGFTAI